MDEITALFDCFDNCRSCMPLQPTVFAFDWQGARRYGLVWPRGLWLCEDVRQVALYLRVLDWERACTSALRAHPRVRSLAPFVQYAGLSILDDSAVQTDGVALEIVGRRELDRADRAGVRPLSRRLRCLLTNRWPRISRCQPYRMRSAPSLDDLRLLHAGLQALQRMGSAPSPSDILPLPDAERDVPQFPSQSLRNELLRERLRRLPVRSGVWDVTVQALLNPAEAEDGGAPVYHLMLIALDEEADAVLQMSVSTLPGADGATELAEAFFEEAVRVGWLPAQLHCANQRTEALLGETLRALSVAVDRRADLPQLIVAYCKLLNGAQD